MDRTGQIFDGRYRLGRLLGQGGMAQVHVARDRKIDKPVAIKVMSAGSAAIPKAAQRFVQEARAVSRVHHPNVVAVTDFGVADDGAAYLVMELLRGEDLAQTLEREGPLPWARVGPIALQICAALAAAHRVSVIHRDIKPSNCFRLHSAGNPDFIKVLDFGIARVADPRHRVVEPTTVGTVLGTPEYMAPEVAAGAEASPAADLYAVGALIYKLLTGSAPFVGDTHRAVLSKQIFDPPVPPRRRAPAREIPEAAEALILRALAKDPAERHPDMAAFAAAIADALPQRPAVELWLAPGESSGRIADLSQAPDLQEPASDAGAAPDGASLAPTLTLARGGPGGAGEPAPRRPAAKGRRWPAVVVGLALALAGALIGRHLAEPAPILEDMPDREGPKDQVFNDRGVSEAPDSAPTDPARPPIAAPPAVADGERAAAEVPAPRRSRTPRFDAEAARGELGRGAAAVQACALDFDMLRGELVLRVAFDGGGKIAEVGPAPGSRRIDPGALACMRRELARTRVEPVAGEVIVAFAI